MKSLLHLQGNLSILATTLSQTRQVGLKMIGLSDATNIYYLTIIPHFNTETYSYYIVKNLDELVIQQMTKFSGIGACLYTDTYYCHPSLSKRLLDKGLNITGPVKSDRKDLPNIIKTAIVSKTNDKDSDILKEKKNESNKF